MVETGKIDTSAFTASAPILDFFCCKRDPRASNGRDRKKPNSLYSLNVTSLHDKK